MFNPVKCISVWEPSEGEPRDLVNVRIEFEDYKSCMQLIQRDVMSDLANWLTYSSDCPAGSFRPFLGGTAGWVWRRESSATATHTTG